MNKKILPVLIECTVNGVTVNKINCKHWSMESSSCVITCAINEKENPDYLFCSSCKNRSPFSEDEIKQMKSIKEQPQEQPKKTFLEKAKSYVKAETSQAFKGKVSNEVYEKRKNICLNCEYVTNNIKHLRDEVGWCKGGCGCSVGNPRAALSQKLYMPTLTCPKNKFGPENGEGFNIKDAADSVKGIATSVANLFEKDK